MARTDTFTRVTGGGWRKIMEYNGALFYQAVGAPDVWMRSSMVNGRELLSYAWDGDGLVWHSLTELLQAIERGPLE